MSFMAFEMKVPDRTQNENSGLASGRNILFAFKLMLWGDSDHNHNVALFST